MSFAEVAKTLDRMSRDRIIVRASQSLVPSGRVRSVPYSEGAVVEGTRTVYREQTVIQVVNGRNRDSSGPALVRVVYCPTRRGSRNWTELLKFDYWTEGQEEEAWASICDEWVAVTPWLITREHVFCRACDPEVDYTSCDIPDIRFLSHLHEFALLSEFYTEILAREKERLDYDRPTRGDEFRAMRMVFPRLSVYVEECYKRIAETQGIPTPDSKWLR